VSGLFDALGWECPRCGETRSPTIRCACADVGRCVWCGHHPDGYPPCRCRPPCAVCGEDEWACRCVRDLDAEEEPDHHEAEELEGRS